MPKKGYVGLTLGTIYGGAAIFTLGSMAHAQPAAPTPTVISDIKPGRGAVPPSNLDQVVAIQGAAANVTNILLRSAPHPPVTKPGCSPTAESFDWNKLGKVTPIANQGSCGDCWAFASIAAFESSFLIENGLSANTAQISHPLGQDGSPPPLGASEQEALDCAEPTYSCSGGWHDKVFNYLRDHGGTTRQDYSRWQPSEQQTYTSIKAPQCKTGLPRQYVVENWNFVSGSTIPSISAIKAAICEHGPVVTAVDAAGWDQINKTGDSYVYSTKSSSWAQDFPDGVLRPDGPTKIGKPSRSDLKMSNLQQGDIDHDVLIVGWDDKNQAWIIKNSWGKTWGDGGFGKVKYNTANLGFSAAWVQARYIKSPFMSSGLIEQLRVLNSSLTNSLILLDKQ